MDATEKKFWDPTTKTVGLILAMMGLLALIGQFHTPQDPDRIDVLHRFAAPGPGQWLGRDELGRDVLSRMIGGAGVTLGVGLLASFLTTVLGTAMGAIAGYKGGWWDALIMRSADVLMCIPTLYLILTLIVILGPGIWNVVVVISVTGWTTMARLVRAEILTLKERDFISAAKTSGASSFHVLWRHLMPNAMGPVYVALTFGISSSMLLESGLSLLGLGVKPPQSSWGSLLNSGREAINEAWWLTVFPGLMIFLAMLLVNHLGERARLHFDPKAQT
jgi:peptide/nickel transport system permease protein